MTNGWIVVYISDDMYKVQIDNMNLQQIADSGQCFRWQQLEENKYLIIAFGKALTITQRGQEFEMSCTKKEWEELWQSYFDVETDYQDVIKRIMESEDEHLKEALEKGSGVRILRQDLWEIVVSFMISQNNNIKRIKKSVDDLCTRCGRRLPEGYAFPRPEDIDFAVFEDKTMGFGYRAPYLKEIYEFAQANPTWLDGLLTMTYDQAMEELMKRKGIGRKVANCICLFGLHHVDAFPIDTHVKQLLEKYYADGFDFDRYQGVAGIVQQYLFYYELME